MTALEILGHACSLGDLLGAGGMGRVYAVEHPHGPLAVKLLHGTLAEDPTMVARLVEEARAGRRVRHPNVVRVVDQGTALGVPYVAMERVHGVPLGVLVQREGALSLARIAAIAPQMLAGLSAIHRAGLIHADMKSDNVLVDVTAGDRVTIIDFGLARPPRTNPRRADPKLVSGTPEYMAPELIRGEPITIAADLYAIGVILYELITGTTPFGGGSPADIFSRQLADDVVPPSLRCPDRTIPPALEAVILRALDKHPAARYRDADMLAAALARAIPPGEHDEPPTRRVSFSTTSPTCDWNRKPPRPEVDHSRRRRLAEGTTPHETAAVARQRYELGCATATREPEAIAVACIALVDALVADHRLSEAARELEAVVAGLAAQGASPDTMWCLLLSLAALYDGLGDPQRARAAAVAAGDAAQEARSQTGRVRAQALLRRLDAARTRSRCAREATYEAWTDIRRIADELEVKIHLATMDVRDRWHELRPRLEKLEQDLARTNARTAETIERELAAIGAALRRLREDVSAP